MKYNYSKLIGRIKECGFTHAELAAAVGINRCTLSAKLNNLYGFTTKDIDSICEILNIANEEIGKYFFAK